MKYFLIATLSLLLCGCAKCVEYKETYFESRIVPVPTMIGKVQIIQNKFEPAHTGTVCARYEGE